MKVDRSTGRIIRDPSESWIAEYVDKQFPNWPCASKRMYADRQDDSNCWGYICPHDGRSVYWGSMKMLWLTQTQMDKVEAAMGCKRKKTDDLCYLQQRCVQRKASH